MTICTRNRECLFGEIKNGAVILNDFGEIARSEWLRTATLRSNVQLDEFIIMPNHFHGIVFISNDRRGTARRAPTYERFGHPIAGSFPTIVRSFKSAVTNRINTIRKMLTVPVWQRNYYESVIRNERELNDMRKYILNNPLQWDKDPENIP